MTYIDSEGALIAAITALNLASSPQNPVSATFELKANYVFSFTQKHTTHFLFGNLALPAIETYVTLTIKGNNAIIDGGGASSNFGIFGASGSLSLENLTIRNARRNTGYGAAVRSQNVNLSIANCVFENNYSQDGGGAIGLVNTSCEITRSQFLNNSSSTYDGGGAIFVSGGGNQLIQDCLFVGNQSNYGGAIKIGFFFQTGNNCEILASTFINNSASIEGGAIYNSSPSSKINYCNIAGNSSKAVYNDSSQSIDATNNYWGAASGPSGAGSGSGDAVSSLVDYFPFMGVAAPSEHLGQDACPAGFTGADATTSGNPISLRLAEKRLDEIDIRLNTALGELAFTRSYRQSQQADLDFMGLGWTHNHDTRLTELGGSPNKIEVYLAGNIVVFYDDNADDTFEGAAGSNSTIVKDSNGYLLTASDESIYEFDTSGIFLSRTLPNNEVWSYSYASGKLNEVTEGYGRKLKFAYYSGETGSDAFKNGLLKRVGTHSSSDLDNSPQSPYIELDYTDDGTGEALLTSVQDVRGEVRSYRYYGSAMGESDPKWTNFLVERFSPVVDQDGDGSPDTAILLESLTYDGTSRTEITEIIQERGDAQIENIFSFDTANGLTTETTAGRTKNHSFSNGVYAGSTNPANEGGSVMPLNNYRPAYQEDARGNRLYMKWDATGRKLSEVMNAAHKRTAFAYDSQDRLISTINAEGRETEYSYGDSNVPQQPTLIRILEGTTVLRRQEFVYDSMGRVLSEKLISPDDETTVLQETTRVYGTTPAQNDYGMLVSMTVKDLLDPSNDSSMVYSYDTQGRVIKTQKTSLFGTCEFNYSVFDAAGNVLGTACGFYNASPAPTDLTGLLALYDANDATKKHSKITTHVYDALGRRVQSTNNAGTSFARSHRTLYDALGRVIRSIQNYVPQGSSAPGAWVWRAVSGVYAWRYSSVDDTVVSHGSNLDENILSETVYNARGLVALSRDVVGRVTVYGYDLADRLVKTVQNASDPDYDNSYATGDPDLSSYVVSSNSEMDLISEQGYDPNGNLVWRKDLRGSVSLTAYDALNRPLKVIANASQADYDILADPELTDYGLYSTETDKDIVSETDYDAMGRVIRNRRLLENRAGDIWDVMLYGYDALGRQIKRIQHASQADYDILADPDLSGYVLSEEADLDLLTETIYDVQGRVLETIDLNGRKTHIVYDGLNRPVKTIANYVVQGSSDPVDWEWLNSQWEDGASNAIDHGTNFDQNILSETLYNSDGRVEANRNVQGLLQHTAYDLAGRQALSIQNYVEQGSSNPIDWLWTNNQWEDGASNVINRGTDFDQNLIQQPDYDDENRVFQRRDARGNLSRQVFDASGRVVMSIQNYVPQGSSEPEDWLWANNQWEDGASNAIDHGTNQDQNRIQTSQYDLLGRVFRSRDPLGRESYTVFDTVGRVRLDIQNYSAQGSSEPAAWLWSNSNLRWEDGASNAIDHGSDFDQNLISETLYNQAGQIVTSRDARGTVTGFVYDEVGRRLQTQQALGTPLETSSYICYDKAGRQLRQIVNYIEVLNSEEQVISPDAWDLNGIWLFAPTEHGSENDQNLIFESVYDAASRLIQRIDPVGNLSSSAYAKDGQVLQMTDPEGMVSAYRYDALRRRMLVVQNYVENDEDPALWLWDATDGRYEQSDGMPIAHGSNNDENIILQVGYDLAGRPLAQRDPRGKLTSYSYDKLGRRQSLSNPLNELWTSNYSEVNGASQVSLSYPNGYSLQQDFDRLGRLQSLDYGDAANTPTVNFAYDLLDNRLSMVENNGTSDVRITDYLYDIANRLKQVDFDRDGDTLVEDSLSYAYDLAGLRTRLSLPGSLEIQYTYDALGRLVSLSDWDAQVTRYSYDKVHRHTSTQHSSGLRSRYRYDAAARLRGLHHEDKGRNSLAEFHYEVDGRGNRTRAVEILKGTGASTQVYVHSDARVQYTGIWSDGGTQHVSTATDARLALPFAGKNNLELTIGTGPDYSIFDIYLDGTFYESIDAYAALAGSRQIDLKIEGDTWHLLELRNRREKNLQSTGYRLAFQSLTVDTALRSKSIAYTYDGLSRLKSAIEDAGARTYIYDYDLAGNRLKEDVTIGITNSIAQWTYTDANQIATMQIGANPAVNFSYDDNGNLLNDGQLSYIWDRANRLKTVDNGSYNTHYAYDGEGKRQQQTVGGIATEYLLDIQPALALVLRETNPSESLHYIHGPRGVQAMADDTTWHFMLADGLGSLRSQLSLNQTVEASQDYSPYGLPFNEAGTWQGSFAYAGEQVDANGLSYNRARYYNPSLGNFASLDPFEGTSDSPMSLNGYAYVHGNPINLTDSAGLCAENPEWWDVMGYNCKHAAEALAARGDHPLEYYMQFSYGDLLGMRASTQVGDIGNLLAGGAQYAWEVASGQRNIYLDAAIFGWQAGQATHAMLSQGACFANVMFQNRDAISSGAVSGIVDGYLNNSPEAQAWAWSGFWDWAHYNKNEIFFDFVGSDFIFNQLSDMNFFHWFENALPTGGGGGSRIRQLSAIELAQQSNAIKNAYISRHGSMADVTFGVARINNQLYVSVGTSRQNFRALQIEVTDLIRRAGIDAKVLPASPASFNFAIHHAEEQLFNYWKSQGGNGAFEIGISNWNGPCPGCQRNFAPRDVFIAYPPNTSAGEAIDYNVFYQGIVERKPPY